ncbi:MAG: RNA-binding S4 domain-containing protein [Salinivirgaceae bacterium]|jgi:ribosome-associated protein|nr:RNA-binding S4 domain-containing protein [Salinivirgaceae bacterium]
MIEFKLRDGDIETAYIELNKLLKATQVVESGAVANICITDGLVKLNGKVDTRKRAKIRKGDKIQFEGEEIVVM